MTSDHPAPGAANGSSLAVGTGSILLTLSGLAAAFGVASCCGLPFLLATAGLGTAWLTCFALLAAPYRSILLVVGAAGLAGGAVLLWRQQRMATCTPGVTLLLTLRIATSLTSRCSKPDTVPVYDLTIAANLRRADRP